MKSFGNVNAEAGLKTLNAFLANESYLDGYMPSQTDVAVFEALTAAPAAEYLHCLRWYNHIKSYGDAKKEFPGEKPKIGAEVESKKEEKKEDDDDIDLFGSDDEDDAEAERVKQERLAAYEAKKSKKPTLVAKSNIILDVKPWDDETDMAKLEECVRSIECDGLLWGASKLVPLAYGIKKLQITCVVEDDKVGTDFLEEEITKFEDFIQSVDIAAFNKI